jgi:hypothetical protein
MNSKLMLMGLIMKFLLPALTIRPKYLTILPPGPNLMVGFKNLGRSLVYLITQQSDQLYFPPEQLFTERKGARRQRARPVL